MAETVLDYLFIGPVHPFRGGISETQHELTKTLVEQGFNVKLLHLLHYIQKSYFQAVALIVHKKLQRTWT